MFSDAAVACGHPIRRFHAAQPHAGAGALRDGAAGPVRMSELFGGGDTLMIYHYMLPRHSQDDRPGPSGAGAAKLPLAKGPSPSALP